MLTLRLPTFVLPKFLLSNLREPDPYILVPELRDIGLSAGTLQALPLKRGAGGVGHSSIPASEFGASSSQGCF